jgi:hypothetical protein
MKKLVNKIKKSVIRMKKKIRNIVFAEKKAVKDVVMYVKNNAAEGYVDTGVKVLISVVIGGLLLALLYTLFQDTVMPTVTQKVVELFSYAG